MANRRCITLDIVDTDAFLDLPVSAQALYFHICVRADDDGFCGSPNKIVKFTNTSTNDIDELVKAKFIILLPKNIVLVKHWWMHNTKRKDTYRQSPHLKDYKNLFLDENGAYTLEKTETPYRADNEPVTQIKLNKTKLNKDNVKESMINRESNISMINSESNNKDDNELF